MNNTGISLHDTTVFYTKNAKLSFHRSISSISYIVYSCYFLIMFVNLMSIFLFCVRSLSIFITFKCIIKEENIYPRHLYIPEHFLYRIQLSHVMTKGFFISILCIANDGRQKNTTRSSQFLFFNIRRKQS